MSRCSCVECEVLNQALRSKHLQVWPEVLEAVEEVVGRAQPHTVKRRGGHLVEDLGGAGGRGVGVEQGLEWTVSQYTIEFMIFFGVWGFVISDK